jgi:hypothetical protein
MTDSWFRGVATTPTPGTAVISRTPSKDASGSRAPPSVATGSPEPSGPTNHDVGSAAIRVTGTRNCSSPAHQSALGPGSPWSSALTGTTETESRPVPSVAPATGSDPTNE